MPPVIPATGGTVTKKLQVMVNNFKIMLLFHHPLQLAEQVIFHLEDLVAFQTDEMMVVVMIHVLGVCLHQLISAASIPEIHLVQKPQFFQKIQGSVDGSQTDIFPFFPAKLVKFLCAEVSLLVIHENLQHQLALWGKAMFPKLVFNFSDSLFQGPHRH